MNNSRVLTEKNRLLIIALILNAGNLLLLLLLFSPTYETSDDRLMNEFAVGVFGKSSPYLVFINYYFGRVLQTLYSVFYICNWYAVFAYIFLFVSFFTITVVLLTHFNLSAVGYVLTGGFLFIFGYQCYIQIQFTKTAAMLALAGGLAILGSIDGKRRGKQILAGILLILLGSGVRFDAAMLGILTLIPLGGYQLWKAFRKEKWHCISRYVITVASFALAIGLAYGAKAISYQKYVENEEWAEYLKWDDNASQLLDYFFPYYSDDRELYEDLGISESDLNYYEEWNVADKEALTLGTLERLVTAQGAYWVSYKTKFLQFWRVIFGRIPEISVFPGCLVLMLGLFVISDKKNWIGYIINIAWMFLLYFYLYTQYRFRFNRIDVCIWAGMILVLFCICEEKREIKLLKIIIPVLVLAITIAINISTIRIRESNDANSISDEMLLQDYMLEHSDDLFCGTVEVCATDYHNNPFRRMKEGSLSNFYLLGSWTVNTPNTEKVLKSFEVYNPYRDMLEKDNIYLISRYETNDTQAYLEENYDADAVLVLIDQIGKYGIFEIVNE